MPVWKAIFQMLGVFGEFEWAMIRERVQMSLARARANGKTLDRPQTEKRTRKRQSRRLLLSG
ncbi:recombinase family protein [Methylacidiphilum caldifontis]|uniref:recombinase family protein n=1 Tax=Methylacidiphilum caldifontis TaxID=2795386 RepID=UPI001A8C04C6|nr:recombinase family protein [Methylacidiphilum caldifontis]